MDICPKCALPMPACVCDTIAKSSQEIEVKTEKRRFGKVSTLVMGFDSGVDIKDVSKALKEKLACGGTVKNNVIELQGNHKGHIKPILIKIGFNEDQIKE